jgi:hypothetical protein
MTGQEKGDLLIEVTTWAGLTVYCNCIFELLIIIGMEQTCSLT